MQIRKATVADADRIADLLTQLGYPGTEIFIRDKIVQLDSHPDAELVVAVEDGEVLGFISIHFIPQIALPGSFARISYFCVEAGVCGRRIGTRLEAYCEHLASDRDCDRIEVHCHSRRKKAHDFYYRQGYEAFSEVSLQCPRPRGSANAVKPLQVNWTLRAGRNHGNKEARMRYLASVGFPFLFQAAFTYAIVRQARRRLVCWSWCLVICRSWDSRHHDREFRRDAGDTRKARVCTLCPVVPYCAGAASRPAGTSCACVRVSPLELFSIPWSEDVPSMFASASNASAEANLAIQRTASQRPAFRRFAAADRKR